MRQEASLLHSSIPRGLSIDVRDDEFECEVCRGTGIVLSDEDDGEGHTARGVNEVACECQMDDCDDMDDEDVDYPYDDMS